MDVITLITLQCNYIDLAPTNPREIRDCVRVTVGSFINNENQSHEILENLLCVMLVKKPRSCLFPYYYDVSNPVVFLRSSLFTEEAIPARHRIY